MYGYIGHRAKYNFEYAENIKQYFEDIEITLPSDTDDFSLLNIKNKWSEYMDKIKDIDLNIEESIELTKEKLN